MKLIDVISARNAISNKSKEPLNFNLAYKFAKFIKATDDDEKFYNTNQEKLIQEYAKRTEDGEFDIKDNRYQFDADKAIELNGKLKELANTEVKIDGFSFSKEELEKINFTIEEVIAINELISD